MSTNIQYLAGEYGETHLIEMMGKHRYPLSMAYITIAFKSLARRDREVARKYFKLAVDTETFGSSDYNLALGYHIRMQADPNWPRWLDESPAE